LPEIRKGTLSNKSLTLGTPYEDDMLPFHLKLLFFGIKLGVGGGGWQRIKDII
jgi:hypothetical protein